MAVDRRGDETTCMSHRGGTPWYAAGIIIPEMLENGNSIGSVGTQTRRDVGGRRRRVGQV